MASASGVSTPTAVGVHAPELIQDPSNSSAGDGSGDRPRLHRRTYSSNSIINGGVVNLSAQNSSSNLNSYYNNSANASAAASANASSTAIDSLPAFNLTSNANNTSSGSGTGTEKDEINAGIPLASPNGGTSSSSINDSEIPSENQGPGEEAPALQTALSSDPASAASSFHNPFTEPSHATALAGSDSIDPLNSIPLPEDQLASNSESASTPSLQLPTADGTSSSSPTNGHSRTNSSVSINPASSSPSFRQKAQLTIPIPPNTFGQNNNTPSISVSLPGSAAQTPTKTFDSDPFDSVKKSASASSLSGLSSSANGGHILTTGSSLNGLSSSVGSLGSLNSPISQFVTPLSSPLPRENSFGSGASTPTTTGPIAVESSRRNKLSIRTPSFGSSSAGSKPGSAGAGAGGSSASNGGSGGGITLNIDEAIQRLLEAGYRGRTSKHVCLKNNEIALICQTAREIFLSQPVVLDLSPPVKVVGDVHGQYPDLIRLFDMCGFPPAANYLFLGDYVDRGKQSLETILLLFCYKIKYPENFFLLRGNHECASVTRVYGFYDECKRRTNIKTWKIFIDTFNTLPVAAIIAQKIFCVHGGLSPSLTNMNQLRSIQRPTDVPDFGLLNDILWSDPADTENEWEDNERGVSYCFNKVAINKFLAKFGFDLVCRAHIVVEDGYEFFNERTLVTVFSAPNYCGEFDNWGAVMSVSEDLLCSFELLKPLDSVALRQEMQRSRRERKHNALAASAPGSMGPQSF